MSDARALPVATLIPEPAVNGELRNRVQQLRLDTQLGSAKAGRGGGAAWLPWALAGVLALTWAGVGVRGYRAAPADANVAVAPTDGKPATATPSPGGTAPVAEPGTIQIEVKGYLVPAVQVAVSPIDVAGQLIELNIKEGEYYKKGDVLARIDPQNYEFAVAEAGQFLAATREKLTAALEKRNELRPESVRQVEKDQILAQLNEAKAVLARADDEFKRLDRIKDSISSREVDTARNDFLAAQARTARFTADLQVLTEGPRKQRMAGADADVAQAQADIKGAEARLASARWRLGNCTIRAPIAGTALSKKSEVGNLVNPLAIAAAAGSVCELADLADLEADLEIPERDISKLRVGQVCRVRADAYPDRQYAGRLDRIMPIANRAKSIVNVRVKVALPADEKPGTYLKPEMGAVVSFLAPAK